MAQRHAGPIWLLWSVLAFLAIAPSHIAAAMFPDKSPVVQLSQSSFKREVLDIEKPTLVAFTAPWCGHCQKLAPEFHKAAVNLDGIVKFANLDCDQDVNKGICAQYQVQGFPTIKLFPSTKKRVPRDYRGERAARALVEYAKDALPMGARKLNGEELDGWINESPWRPKVILFTTKSKSSPLYRSLALDFRKTLDFAFMRGDEQLVRSSGRLVLGIDIPTAETLPVLMIVPGREVDDDGNVKALEKGNFETYVGPLKYHKIKAWLDEVSPKMKVRKLASKAAKAKASEKAKADSAKGKVQAAAGKIKAKYEQKAEEILPEGAFVEWKAQKPLAQQRKEKIEAERLAEAAKHGDADDLPIMDESAPGENTWRGTMADIERAGEIADQVRAEAEEAGRKTKKFVDIFHPSISDDDEAEKDSESLLDKASKVYGDVTQKAFDAAEKVTQGLRSGGVGDGQPFSRKGEALMKQFSKWMAGEAPQEWEEQLKDQYARAQKEAEELLRTDPEEAAKQAWASEKWLLDEMQADKERMYDVMTVEQRAQVDNMIELIQSRLARKGRMNPFEREQDSNGFPFSGGQEHIIGGADKPAVAEKKKSHDEL